jgi:hypothetical protein
MNSFKTIASIFGALALGGLFLAGPSLAENQWQENHPGRTRINHRLKHQNHRLEEGIKHGKISESEAQQIHSEDQSIHNQEVQDAAAHHGHLTRNERKQLNHEENAESRQIHEDRHN